MKLDVKNISKSFARPGGVFFSKGEKVHAVKNISFELQHARSLGLVGESGSGKTTVSKMIAGLMSPDEGSVLFEGTNVHSLSRKERAKKVQMIFQDPFASLNPKLLLETQLLEGMATVRLADLKSRSEKLMSDVGLPAEFLKRYPHQLSGGQRQRFAIARALSMEPELLIADEPVSSLDLSVQAQIINLLNALRQKKNFMLIIISHDLAVIANLCEEAMIMKDGDVVEKGAVQSLLTAPKTDYARKLVQATPTV